MQSASVQVSGLIQERTYGLAGIKSPSLRKSLFDSLKKNCCPELKDQHVKKVFTEVLNIENFRTVSHGPDLVTFEATIPGLDGTFVTSRKRLQQAIGV